MSPNCTELLKRNAKYAVGHKPIPTIKDIVATGITNLPRTIIITCADARVMPESILSLEAGEVLVCRTIAGHPQTALEAIVAVDIQTGGVLQEIMILYHTGQLNVKFIAQLEADKTDCGSQYFDVPRIRAGFAERDPSRAAEIQTLTFAAVGEQYGSASLEDALRHDAEWLKGQPAIRKEIMVKGCLYDLESGRIEQVV